MPASGVLPSGKRLPFANLKMAIEIVDFHGRSMIFPLIFPLNMVIFHSYGTVYQRVATPTWAYAIKVPRGAPDFLWWTVGWMMGSVDWGFITWGRIPDDNTANLQRQFVEKWDIVYTDDVYRMTSINGYCIIRQICWSPNIDDNTHHPITPRHVYRLDDSREIKFGFQDWQQMRSRHVRIHSTGALSAAAEQRFIDLDGSETWRLMEERAFLCFILVKALAHDI